MRVTWTRSHSILLRLADNAIVRYAMQSTDEIPLFSSAWGVPASKLRFVPYFYTITDEILAGNAPPQQNYVFSGGNSHRDYAPLIKAIDALRGHEFVIATRLLDNKKLPPNVRAGPVTRDQFFRHMRASRAVVVPLKRGLIRAVGQQTYLNAMFLKKPAIVTDTLGVRDHVSDGRTAIIVDGSPDSYIQAIRRVFNPENKALIGRMCDTAHQTVLEQYTFQNHATRLLSIIDEALQESSQRVQ